MGHEIAKHKKKKDFKLYLKSFKTLLNPKRFQPLEPLNVLDVHHFRDITSHIATLWSPDHHRA